MLEKHNIVLHKGVIFHIIEVQLKVPGHLLRLLFD